VPPMTRAATQRRRNANPSVMPVLEAECLVTRRTGGRAGRSAYWFLTPAGRAALTAIGTGEPNEA
jgi:hypothetical protein